MSPRIPVAFYNALEQLPWQTSLRYEEPLAPKTTVRAGGSAALFLSIHTLHELETLFELIARFSIPWFLLGKGSNLIVKSEGFPGVVIQLVGSFQRVERLKSNTIEAGAGISNIQLTRFARKQALEGVEFLSTIPGTLGGAIYMNAGAHGVEIASLLIEINLFHPTLGLKKVSPEELDFSYRHSRVMQSGEIILSAKLTLHPGDPVAIEAKEREFFQARKKTQPIEARTWGSVFKNPPNDSAGRLIESCGLKGRGVGRARISPKHANFIENTGGATGEELLETAALARSAVYKEYGILLQMEGRIIP